MDWPWQRKWSKLWLNSQNQMWFHKQSSQYVALHWHFPKCYYTLLVHVHTKALLWKLKHPVHQLHMWNHPSTLNSETLRSLISISCFSFKYDTKWTEGKLTCTKADHFLFIMLVYYIPVSVYSKRYSGPDQWEIQFQLPWLLIKMPFCQKQHWDQIHPLMPNSTS